MPIAARGNVRRHRPDRQGRRAGPGALRVTDLYGGPDARPRRLLCLSPVLPFHHQVDRNVSSAMNSRSGRHSISASRPADSSSHLDSSAVVNSLSALIPVSVIDVYPRG